MAGERINIATLDLDVKSMIQKMYETSDSIKYMRDQQKLLTEESKKYNSESRTGREQLERIGLQQQKNALQIKQMGTEYTYLSKAVQAQVKVNGELITKEEAVNLALNAEIVSIASARENNKSLLAIRNQLNPAIEKEAAQIAELNKRYDENTDYIKANASASEQQKMNIGDYKNQIVEAAQELNIFNGGFAGFLARAQQAGGVLPLVTTSLRAMAVGIGGITKASLTFLATPIGAVIGAIGLTLGLLINYLKNTQGGIDKITSVTRPLQAIFQSLIGVFQQVGKLLFDAFSNPLQSIKSFGNFIKDNIVNRFMGILELIPALGKSIELLFKGEFAEAGKTAFDAVSKVVTGVEGMTGKITGAANATGEFFDEAYKKGQLIDQLQKSLDKGAASFSENMGRLKQEFKEQNLIAEDTNKSLAQREASAARSIEIAREMKKLELDRLDIEIKLLETKQSLNDTSDAEKTELAELVKKRGEASATYIEMETTQNNKVNTIRREAHQKELERTQKALDASLQKMQIEFDIFMQMQDEKGKSIEEQLALSEQVRKKQIEIANAEYKASERTENDKLKRTKAINEANIAFAESQSNAVIANAERELAAIAAANKSKLDNNKFLNDAMVQQEIDRLNIIAEAEKDAARVKLEGQKASQEEINVALQAIDDQNLKTQTDLKAQREAAEAQKRMTDLENQKVINEENFLAQLEIEREQMEMRREQELADAEKTGADKSLINEKYAALDKKIDKSVTDFKLQARADLLSGLSGLFGKESKMGKALAIDEIMNTTYQNASKAFALAGTYAASGNIPLAVNAKIQGGIIIASGIANASKISGAKFEKGGLQEIGGRRHSAGGTKFMGEDGTAFEAEQGELIGVMNRSAARHFMAFNNAYGGSAPVSGYLASGGFVSRPANNQEINYEILATSIAQANASLPSPVVAVKDISDVSRKMVSVNSDSSF